MLRDCMTLDHRAASRRSEMRPLVQDPDEGASIFVPMMACRAKAHNSSASATEARSSAGTLEGDGSRLADADRLTRIDTPGHRRFPHRRIDFDFVVVVRVRIGGQRLPPRARLVDVRALWDERPALHVLERRLVGIDVADSGGPLQSTCFRPSMRSSIDMRSNASHPYSYA